MKHIILSAACLLLTLNVSAQDATQAKGSWYLGSGDATQLLHIFSAGVDIAPTVGYAVADNIVVQGSMGGPIHDLNMNLGLAYFMGDVWVGAQASDLTGDLDANINVGYWIDFKDVLYITPNLQYRLGLPFASTDFLNIGIGFGAKF